MIGFLIGLYLGIGIGWTMFALAETGPSRGLSLLWRVPFVALFWPVHWVYAVAGER